MHLTERLRIAALAWHEIKPAEDPDFNSCTLPHRERLIAQVEALERGGAATNDFEKAAKRLMDAELKAPEPEPEAPAGEPAIRGVKGDAQQPTAIILDDVDEKRETEGAAAVETPAPEPKTPKAPKPTKTPKESK